MTEYKIYAYNQKRNEFENLKKKYTGNGEITWSTFNANQNNNKEKVVLLQNSDFANGTLRIHAPCLLKLTENISFNPNRPTSWLDQNNQVTNNFANARKINPNRTLDWMPNPSATNNSQYFQPEVSFAYGLGFFAAIAIECENVLFDMNNFLLQQHKEHALQQRFYAHIELADQPFMPLQGPSNFGAVIRSATNTFIYNGRFGLSSHHGIHGNNGGNDIMFENVTFDDCEVAAFALNGFKNVFGRNVTVNKNRHDIPVVGTYSAARFIKLFIKAVEDKGHGNAALTTAKNALNADLDETFNSIIFNNGTVTPYFKNETGLLDGIGYGFLFNPIGVAVNKFLEDRSSSKANESTNVYMINCNVNNIKTSPHEIIAVGHPNGGAQVDTAGAVLQFYNGVANLVDDKYYYGGTSLSNVQIELAKIKYSLDNQSISSAYLGTLNIHKGIQDWMSDNSLYFQEENNKLKLYNGNGTPYQLNSNDVEYDIIGNGDSMFHVAKGTIGIKIDGVNNMCMLDCGISNIINEGDLGTTKAGNYKQSHPLQGPKLVGYQNAKCFGMTVAAVNNLTTENLQIYNIESKNASAHGQVIMNGTQNCTFNNTCINGIYSNKDGVFDGSQPLLPNEVPISRGIMVTHDCLNIKLRNPTVQNIVNSSGNPYNLPYDLHTKVLCEQ